MDDCPILEIEFADGIPQIPVFLRGAGDGILQRLHPGSPNRAQQIFAGIGSAGQKKSFFLLGRHLQFLTQKAGKNIMTNILRVMDAVQITQRQPINIRGLCNI